MIFSPSEVLPISASTGFRAEMIEKVLHLLNLLDQLNRHPTLKCKWVLKGGTALNLFVFDLPRLSVDIDLNYVGALEREAMLADRPNVEQAAQAVFSREGFTTKRVPTEHAGGKWRLSYQSYTGQSGNLAALLARGQARDLFDCHRIFTMKGIDRDRLRLAFIVYGGMNRKDWRTVSITDVNFDPDELARLLIPTLNRRFMEKQGPPAEYGKRLVKECQAKLEAVLPLNDPEREFLDLLLEKGEIDASALTPDKALQERIHSQPLLQWKALNVKRHKGLG